MGVESHPANAFLVREFRGEEDAAEVTNILRATPEATMWSELDLLQMGKLSGVTAYVSIRSDRVTGIVIGRRVADEAEILNLAVRQENWRHGEGRRLVGRLLEACRVNGVSRVFLEVRESNLGAVAFYQKLGFGTVGKRKDYYQGPKEDALVMERRLWKSTEANG